MLTACSRTHPGTVRTINEDSLAWEPELAFFAIADGMGGHNAGEVASATAIERVRNFLSKSASGKDFTWPFGVNPRISAAANRLMTAIKIANRHIFRVAEERAEYGGMGTTLVGGLVEDRRVTFASVGDSRMYSYRASRLEQLTRDDSWIMLLTEQSGLEPSAFEHHPMRHVLTNVVGARPELDVTIQELDLVDGQILMLCTDGLHGALTDDAMRAILEREPEIERAAETLVAEALERDGRDNISVLLVHYAGSP